MSPLVRPVCVRRAALLLKLAPLAGAERPPSAQALRGDKVIGCMRLPRAHKGLRKLLPAFLPGDPSLCITAPSPPAPTARTLNVYIIPCTAGVGKPGHNQLLAGPFTVSSTSPVGLHICMCSAPVITHTRMHTCYPQLFCRTLFAGNHLQERNTETLAFSDNFCHWQPPHNF